MASTSNGSSSEALLRSRVEDALLLAERRCIPSFLGFLDETEQQLARQFLAHADADRFAFWGGYDDAERCVLGCFPEYMMTDNEAFPLERVTFRYRAERTLTHRDVLGTLMSQGIKRETVGDILCADGLVVVFLRAEIAPYIREQITKIGGVGVRVSEDENDPLPQQHRYVEMQDTIASPRLDAVLKALLHTSREKAAQMIASGSVSVNHLVCTEVSETISTDTVISVRGYGRFVVDRIGPPTKKGRLHLEARKCI